MPLAQHHDVMRLAERRFAFPLFNESHRSLLLPATDAPNSRKVVRRRYSPAENN